jgi:hypothetical protein
MLCKWLKIPEKLESLARADANSLQGRGRIASLFGEFWRRLKRGAAIVWSRPALKYSFLTYTATMILNPFLYTVLAPAYGMRLLGPGDPQASGVYSMLTGLYSAGGLVGGLIMLVQQRRLKGAGEDGEKLRRSMLRWTLWGTVSIAAIATLALPLPILGALVTLPGWLAWAGAVTVPALALIPFGLAQAVANIKQENFFVAKVPEGDINEAIGFLGAASLAVATAGLVGLKFLFTGRLPFGWRPVAAFAGLAGFTPFLVIAAALVPLAACLLFLRHKLAAASAPAAPK